MNYQEVLRLMYMTLIELRDDPTEGIHERYLIRKSIAVLDKHLSDKWGPWEIL